MIEANELIVLAVSGGADSMALLHLFHELQPLLNLELHIATFNHGLRAEAGDDVNVVREAAEALKIPITTEGANVAQLAQEKGIGLEAAAREARYRFLAAVALDVGAGKVATAHHADDQVETVLMHVLRGSGLSGAAGMALVSGLPYADSEDIVLIRPLLHITGATLRHFCHVYQIPYVDDPTNLDPTWTRNRIRHEVLPFLRNKINSNVDQAILRFSEISQVDHEFLELATEESLNKHITQDRGRVTVDRRAFQRGHPAIQRRCILRVLNEYFPQCTPSMEHVLRAVEQATRGKLGAIAEFTTGVHMRVDYESLHFEATGQSPIWGDHYLLPEIDMPIRLRIPGETPVPDMGWSVATQEESTVNELTRTDLKISYNSKEDLWLRNRRSGDRFQPAGMHGHSQKVTDWMINRKVPRNLRKRVPILADSNRIYAILWDKRWHPSFQLNHDNGKSILLRIIHSKTRL